MNLKVVITNVIVKNLNKKYYNKGDYRKLDKKEIDFNTFNDKLAGNEISDIKNKIKILYKYKSIYLYSELLEKIKESLKENQKDLFEDYYLDKALNMLMPRTQNDFNNFNDIVFDKFNEQGYIILRDKYYLFQPFDENEDVPFSYRNKQEFDNENLVSLDNYLKIIMILLIQKKKKLILQNKK